MNFKVTLYKPIEIELEGQKFTLRKLNRQMFRALEDFEKKERAATSAYEKIEIMYEMLRAFVDAPAEVIDNLDQEEVHEFTRIINEVVFKQRAAAPETAEETAEKNGPKPGEEPAVS